MSVLQFILINLNLVALFGVYLLLSRGKRNFHFNRFFLLLAPVLAIVLPLISFEPSANPTFYVELPTIEVLKERAFIGSTFEWETLIYGTGLLVFFGFLIVQLYQVFKPKKAQYHSSFNGSSVFVMEDAYPSHSFFKRIYLNMDDLMNEHIVLTHEYEHCRGLHTIDLILGAVYKSVFWFNPVIFMWYKAIRENHEFIADQKVMEGDVSAAEYGTLIVNMNFQITPSPLVNTFSSKSLLRKRIENLNLKNQTPMKNLIVIPVVVGLAIVSMSMTSNKMTEPTVEKTSVATSVKGDDVDVKPEYPGGKEALYKFMAENIHYPKDLEQKGVTGKVFVEFTIDKTGKIKDVTVQKSSDQKAMDNEAMRVIKKMPSWKPAEKDGKAVSTKMTIPIVFAL